MKLSEMPNDLQRAREQLRAAERVMRVGSWELSASGEYLAWSEEACRIAGLAPEQAPATFAQSLALFHPDDRAALAAAVERAWKGAEVDLEHRLLRADGEVREVHTRAQLHADTQAQPCLSGALHDITERKQAERRAERLAERLTNTLESITDGFLTFDRDWHFTYLNAAAERMLRRRREDLIGKYVWGEFKEAVGGPSYQHYHRAFRDNCTVSFEEFYAPLDAWLEVLAFPSEEGLAVYFHDISERKREALALQRSNRALELASAPAGSGERFFELLVRNMAEAVGARSAGVVRLLPGLPARARTLSAVRDGVTLENVSYLLADAPCARVLEQGDCVVDDLAQSCPALAPVALGDQAYAGCRLDSSDGRPLGLVFATFGTALPERAFIVSTLQIFAARAAAELERQDADARLRGQASLLDKAQDAIVVRGVDRRISFWNKSAERLYGWTQAEALGQQAAALFGDDPAQLEAAERRVLESGDWSGEMTRHGKDGRALTVEVRWTLVNDDEGRPKAILAIDTDITQRKADEREIQQLAFYDVLTGLPNRLLMIDRLQHAVAVSARSGRAGALLFIDLDNFKTLNDTLGHDKGDLLLQLAALRIQAVVSAADTVARFGGDEFVVMLENLGDGLAEAAARARAVAERVLDAMNRPFLLDDYEHHGTSSIGATLFDHAQGAVGDFLKRADLALHQAKAAGRDTIRFFDPAMQTAVLQRAALEADLRNGLQDRQFDLHYQPQLDAAGRVTGVEALVRWNHPVRGMVSPADFIPLAEDCGLILPLGHWVLETACRQLVRWARGAATAQLTVAVNVSARQLRHPGFVDEVLAALAASGADPALLKLELTESLLVDDIEVTIAKMAALKRRGVGFSLDDFGTGYSSLAYLKRLPLDQLKIDQSFVREVLADPNDAAIVRTIIALGESLGIAVIAEGVETAAQRAFLVSHGCHAYQGYLFSRPLPAAQFEAWLGGAL